MSSRAQPVNGSNSSAGGRARCTVAAGALALLLIACGEKPSADDIGKDVNRTLDRAGRQAEEAVGAAERQLAQAGKAISEGTAQAGKVIGDAALTGKVKAAFVAESDLKSMAIDVDTAAGVVTLYGTVDTAALRDKAAQVASNVDGVKSVRNNLVVLKGS